MLSNSAHSTDFPGHAPEHPPSKRLLVRKIWLPHTMYQALPYFYVGAGISAFLATLYINQWFWVLPHYVLFSGACIHLGIAVFGKRRHPGKKSTKTT